eukprot:comp17774_c1_seq1/m.17810 comp17774_c1_seq1/g.17810  ORF comp17774_c1_seq1/g.17810 comp17774_c1_seq1/m.17810 type:complete len:354 (-) comp17774_c1_seq1:339-1400(-)
MCLSGPPACTYSASLRAMLSEVSVNTSSEVATRVLLAPSLKHGAALTNQLVAEACLASLLLDKCFGVYVIPQDHCPHNAHNPFLSEVRAFYALCQESPDPQVSGANFVSWGGLFHITVAGFVEAGGPGGEQTLQAVLQFLHELNTQLEAAQKSVHPDTAIRTYEGSKPLGTWATSTTDWPSFRRPQYYGPPRSLPAQSGEGHCDCSPVQLVPEESGLVAEVKPAAARIIMPNCEVLKMLTDGMRTIPTYAAYNGDKIRGDGVKFHFTLANADSVEAFDTIKRLISDNAEEFPLLAGLFEGKDDWKHTFMSIRWQLVVVAYEGGTSSRTRRRQTFGRVPGMAYALARRRDGRSL